MVEAEIVAGGRPLSSKEEASFRLMRLIEQNSDASQREMAEAAGISLGKAHYVLSALIDCGFVKLKRFGASGNKRAYSYVLTPSGFARKATMARRFLARKRHKFEELRQEIDELANEVDLGPTQIDR